MLSMAGRHTPFFAITRTVGRLSRQDCTSWSERRFYCSEIGGKAVVIVNKLLSIFQRANFAFPTFRELSKIEKHCSHIISRQKEEEDVMNTGLVREFIVAETVGGNRLPVLYKKVIVVVLQNQVFLLSNKAVTYRRGHNGWGAACVPINSNFFENAEQATVRSECFPEYLKFTGTTKRVMSC